MAEHLLGKITLGQDYDATVLVDDNASDLTNATITGATVGVQLSNQLYITTTTTVTTVDCPVGITVDFEYGGFFTVNLNVDVVTGGSTSRSVRADLLRGSTLVGSSNSTVLASGANVVSLDVTATGDWDTLRLRFQRRGGAPEYDITDLFIVNDFYDSFNTGDKIVVYWDDVADDFLVQRQDIPGGGLTTITTGPNLGTVDLEQLTETGIFNFCDGTTLVSFTFDFASPDFPYFGKVSVPNSIFCLATPIACDCFFTGSYTITGATNAYSADGSVQLSATPTTDGGPVKFTEFNPSIDFRGQYYSATNTSGLFSNLKAGSHKFYCVDSYGCFSEISVVIPATSETSYNPKYRISYYDVHTQVQSTVDIQERGYGGDVVYVDGAGDVPFKLSKETGELNNKLDALRPTFAELNLNSGEHFQFISLYTQDDRKYKLSFTHGTTSWIGYVVPSVYREEYSPSKNYPVKLTATDGINSLGDYDFVDPSGNTFTGYMSLRQVILECLNKIDLQLSIIIGINKYASGMSSTTADDPLGQTYVDAETFLSDDFVPKKCDEVLEAVLQPFGAFVIQKNSKWHIIEFEQQTSPYYYREYDYLGAFVTSGSINAVINIDRPYVTLENVLFSGSPSLEVVPAYGRISVFSKVQSKSSIFPLKLTEWTVNINSSPGSIGLPSGGGDGISFSGLNDEGTGIITLVSKKTDVFSYSDGVDISFDYILTTKKYSEPVGGVNQQNINDPVFTRIEWELYFEYASVVYYWSEAIGWNRQSAITTSITSNAIPTTHPTAVTFTVGTSLTIQSGTILKIVSDGDTTKYFRAIVDTYNPFTGSLVVDSYANPTTGTFSDWTMYAGGPDFKTNRIYATEYGDNVGNFSKKINLPELPAAQTVTLQFALILHKTRNPDFTTIAGLRLIPSAVYQTGYKVTGVVGGNLVWYVLSEGTDADNGGSIIRSADFNATSNAVVWEYFTGGLSVVNQIHLMEVDNFRLKFLPNRSDAERTMEASFNNTLPFKETLDYEIQLFDLPSSVAVGHETYKNILRTSSGTPTSGWARRGFNESNFIQDLLVKTLGNQYSSPVWRLSGDWLGPDITTTSIIKHTVKQLTFTTTNPDLPGGSGWSQAGAGTTWTSGGTYYEAVFTGAGDSLIIRQVASLVAGVRIKVDFNIIRLGSAGTRVDRLVLVLFNGEAIIQTETILDKIETDTDSTWTSWIQIENTCDKFGFYVENMTGSGAATYRINTFTVTGVPSVRYYYLNRMDRQDRMNLYRAEMVQIVPVERANTQDDVNGSGGFAGDSWSSGLSTGFGVGFGNISYWG